METCFRELCRSLNKVAKSLKSECRIDLCEASAVVKAIDLVRKKNKGQYLDNVSEIFATENKWSSGATTEALKV